MLSDAVETVQAQGSDQEPSKPRNLADWITHLVRPILVRRVTSGGISAVFAAIFTLIILGLTASNYVKPNYNNWDMAPYLAIMIDDGKMSNEELHRQSWDITKGVASPYEFQQLTEGNGYRAHQYQNPDDYVSMFPMYSVKVGYLESAKFLGRFVGPVDALHLLSIASALFLGFVMLNWLHWGKALHAAPLALGAVLVLGYVGLGRIAVPDMMAAFFFVWGCERYMRKQEWLGVALLLVSLFVRPDTILFMFALLLASFGFGMRIMPALVGFGAAIASYLLITSGIDHPGWWIHFYFSAVEIQNTLIGFDPAVEVMAFAKAYARGIIVGLRDHNWWAILSVALTGWILLSKRPAGLARRSHMMLWACFMALGAKFLLFPLPESRFYIGFLTVMVMVLLVEWRPQLVEDKPTA